MTTGKWIVTAILWVLAGVAFVLSGRQFREKGAPLNNAYLYATKQQRERMEKGPLYRQSAIVFLLLGVFLILDGCAQLPGLAWIGWLAGGAAAAALLYAVISGVRMGKPKQKS